MKFLLALKKNNNKNSYNETTEPIFDKFPFQLAFKSYTITLSLIKRMLSLKNIKICKICIEIKNPYFSAAKKVYNSEITVPN